MSRFLIGEMVAEQAFVLGNDEGEEKFSVGELLALRDGVATVRFPYGERQVSEKSLLRIAPSAMQAEVGDVLETDEFGLMKMSPAVLARFKNDEIEALNIAEAEERMRIRDKKAARRLEAEEREAANKARKARLASEKREKELDRELAALGFEAHTNADGSHGIRYVGR